jgi:hypothetical protein
VATGFALGTPDLVIDVTGVVAVGGRMAEKRRHLSASPAA